jgi:hypothetical protein
MGKAKRGRPRSDRERYPSGQVKPESAGITGAALQRLRALGSNPLLETQVGRLLFLEQIRPIDAQTAFRIAEIYGRYDRAMGRRRSAASPSYEMGRGRDGGLHESDAQKARAESAARAFGALQAEIKLCPRGVKGPLEELCVEDGVCPPGWLPAVKIALDMLAVPLGIRRMRRGEGTKPSPHKGGGTDNIGGPAGGQQEVFASIARNLAGMDLETSSALWKHFEALYREEEFQKARRDRERFRAVKARK